MQPTRRTPDVSLKETFLRAAADLPAIEDRRSEDGRAGVVAEALGHLQSGFDSHYAPHPVASGEAAGCGAADEEILVGDNAYAWAVETIARLDEPRFVAVASRMIRDGAGSIAEGEAVTLELWTPHLGALLDVISGEGQERSEARIRAAAAGVGETDGG